MRIGSRYIVAATIGAVLSGAFILCVVPRARKSGAMSQLQRSEVRSPSAVRPSYFKDAQLAGLEASLTEAEKLVDDFKKTGAKDLEALEKALDLEIQTCAGGNVKACASLKNVAALHPRPEFAEQASNVLKQVCGEGDLQVCTIHGHSLLQAGDTSAALQTFKTACDKGSAESCSSAAWSLRESERLDEAYPLAKKACELDRGQCSSIVRYFPNHPELKSALEATEDECRSGSGTGATACMLLGTYYMQTNQELKAMTVLDLDCEKSNSTACLLAGAVRFNSGDEAGGLAKVKSICASQISDRAMAEFATAACKRLSKGQKLTRQQAMYVSTLANGFLKGTN